MTVDEYLVWAESHPGKYELQDGLVVAMAAERASHAEMKFAVQTELRRAIKAAKLNCHMLPDGMTVRTEDKTAYEPDALVYCGQKLPGKELEVRNPVIVVEVLSPSTGRHDSTTKLEGYLGLPSLKHYMIVNSVTLRLVLHSPSADGIVRTQILSKGKVKLDPPGMDFNLDNVFSPA